MTFKLNKWNETRILGIVGKVIGLSIEFKRAINKTYLDKALDEVKKRIKNFSVDLKNEIENILEKINDYKENESFKDAKKTLIKILNSLKQNEKIDNIIDYCRKVSKELEKINYPFYPLRSSISIFDYMNKNNCDIFECDDRENTHVAIEILNKGLEGKYLYKGFFFEIEYLEDYVIGIYRSNDPMSYAVNRKYGI